MNLRVIGFFWLLVVFVASAARSEQADIVVYGGTAGGVSAAVQAARMQRSVILIEPGRHLGGLASSGLGATDIGKEHAIGGIAREYYRRIKAHYAQPQSWTWQKATDYKSHRHDRNADIMWYAEPHVAEKIFDALVREAGVTVIRGERLDLQRGVLKEGTRIRQISMESGRTFTAAVFIDASYEGDVMAKAGVSYHVGREANSVYGENLNGVQTKRVPYNGHNFYRPVDPYKIPGDPSSGLIYGIQAEPPSEEGSGDHRVQSYCFRGCFTNVPENRVPFPKPPGYDPAHYELVLRYLRTEGTDLRFADHPKPRPIEHPGLGYNPFTVIMPNLKTDSNTKGAVSFNFVGGSYAYPDADYATRELIIAAHRTWQQGLLWFLQNDPRVPAAYREPMQTWGLPKDEFTDNGHWPHQLYVREARRMIGEFVLTEHECAGRRTVSDGIGLGSYGMDSHVVQRYVDQAGHVRNEGNIGGPVPKPYPISYRSLTPKRSECENLLVPVCISATHVAYGSIRMEPVYMIMGQAAGTAAVHAIEAKTTVQGVDAAKLRRRLQQDGQILE